MSKDVMPRPIRRRTVLQAVLPPQIALMPNKVFYRAGDHQLMPDLYVGHAVEKGPVQEDLFHIDKIVKGVDAAPPVSETDCHLAWPTV